MNPIILIPLLLLSGCCAVCQVAPITEPPGAPGSICKRSKLPGEPGWPDGAMFATDKDGRLLIVVGHAHNIELVDGVEIEREPTPAGEVWFYFYDPVAVVKVGRVDDRDALNIELERETLALVSITGPAFVEWESTRNTLATGETWVRVPGGWGVKPAIIGTEGWQPDPKAP